MHPRLPLRFPEGSIVDPFYHPYPAPQSGTDRFPQLLARLIHNSLLTDDPQLLKIIHIRTLLSRAAVKPGERCPPALRRALDCQMWWLGYQSLRCYRPTPRRSKPDYINQQGEAVYYPESSSSTLECARRLAKALTSDPATQLRLRFLAEGLPDPMQFPPQVLAAKITRFLRRQKVMQWDELVDLCPFGWEPKAWLAVQRHLQGITSSGFKAHNPDHLWALRRTHHLAWVKIRMAMEGIGRAIQGGGRWS